MYGLSPTTEPRRLWPCGDVAVRSAVACAGMSGGHPTMVGLAAGEKSLGTGRWCP